ncbi:MAG: PDZ domain-containing protein [Fibrobacterota bacterium]
MYSERVQRLLLPWLAASLLFCASCTEFLGPSKPDFDNTEALNEQLFCWTALSVFYIFQDKMPQNPLDYTSPATMYEQVSISANDPWTHYIPPEDADAYLGNFSSENEAGIGIFIGKVGDTCFIRFVIDHSPAQSAGLHKHDTLLAANGQTLVGISDTLFYERLSGPVGSRATLSIKRDSTLSDIQVTRDSFDVPTVLTDTLDDSVAYIWLNIFLDATPLPGGTSAELHAALAETDAFSGARTRPARQPGRPYFAVYGSYGNVH